MTRCNDICTGKQHIFKILYVHLVIVTKCRYEVFCGTHLDGTQEIVREVRADFGANWSSSTARPNTSTCRPVSRQPWPSLPSGCGWRFSTQNRPA